MLVLSLICACAGLICSSAVASADTGHGSGTPLVTGAQALGRGLAGTSKGLLGSQNPAAARHAHNRAAAEPARGRVTARRAEAVTSLPSTKPRVLVKHPVIKHPLIKHPAIKHPVMNHPLVKHPVIKQLLPQQRTRHQHRSQAVSDTDGDAGTLIGSVTDTVGTAVHSTSGSVHGISSRVGSTADPSERAGEGSRADRRAEDVGPSVGGVARSISNTTDSVGSAVDGTAGIADGVAHPDRLGAATGAEITRTSVIVHGGDDVVRSTGAVVGSTGRTVAAIGGDRSEPVGGLVGDVGDAVTSVGSTVDRVGQAADDLDTSVENTAGGAVARTVDLTVATTIGSTTVGTLTETITNTLTGTVGVLGATITNSVEPIGSALQPLDQTDQGLLLAGASDPVPHGRVASSAASTQPPTHARARAVRASARNAWAPQRFMSGPASTADQAAGSHTRAEPAGGSDAGSLLQGPGGAQIPGQLPQPTGEMITASSSGGTWQEHGTLGAGTKRTVGSLLDSRGSSSGQPQTGPYDPGYSPD